MSLTTLLTNRLFLIQLNWNLQESTCYMGNGSKRVSWVSTMGPGSVTLSPLLTEVVKIKENERQETARTGQNLPFCPAVQKRPKHN